MDGAPPALLIALLQEYAAHQGPIAEAQRRRREVRLPMLLLGGGGGLVFVVCLLWMLIEVVGGLGPTRPPRAEPPWMIGMLFGGFGALFMGFTWLMMAVEERRKIAAGEAGKADVMRRLLAAFPQLQAGGAEALLSGQAAQAITTRPS